MKRLRLIGALACAAALLAVLPALAPASVQVGSSGWQWGNPLPQGNTLRSISFAGVDGYAAGDFGTLLRTTDGGATWSGLLERHLHQPERGPGHRRPTRSSPRAAASRGARTTAAPPSRAWPSRPSSPAARSSSRPAGSSTAVTGFLVLDRRHHPADRQQRRHLRPEEPAARDPRARRGGDARRPALPDRPDRRRGDLGRQALPHHRRRNSWSLVSDTARAMRSFFFLDANNGYAVGDGSLFLVTKDGGATWTPKDIGIPPTNLRSIRARR